MDTIPLTPPSQTGTGPGRNPCQFTSAADRAPHGAWSLFARLARSCLETLLLWQERERMRRELLALDGRLLKDIGLRRADVLREARKPFWRT